MTLTSQFQQRKCMCPVAYRVALQSMQDPKGSYKSWYRYNLMFSFWDYMSCSVPTSTFQGVIPYPAQVKFALALWKNDIDQSSLLSRRGTAVSTLKGSKSHRQRTRWEEVIICDDFLRKTVQCVTTFNRCLRCFRRGGGCPIRHSI